MRLLAPQSTGLSPKCRALASAAAILIFAALGFAQVQSSSTPGNGQVSKAVGVIKSIQTDSITIAAESGNEVTAKLTGSTKILRVSPQDKDLMKATPLTVQDLQPGDRVLVRGPASTEGAGLTISALAVIVMKQSDVAARQQRDRDDWQKRGVGGLVTKVDSATGTITISSGGIGTTRSIAIHVAGNTVLRRYAPGSVRFDDAKPVPATQFMAQIKAGDQLRARGTRTADGNELNAEEIVAGSFRNIAGTIKAIDTATNTMTVQDAISKSTLVVKVSTDSQMKKLPAEMAQHIAIRLKSSASGEQPSGKALRNTERPQPGAEKQPGHAPGNNAPQDFQRMLSRLPNSTLADLKKDDAVMIVASEGATSDAVTAITLLAGVEDILTAAPNRSASSLLTPWSLSAPGGEGEGAQ